MSPIRLVPIFDKQIFIKDIQKAFQDSYESVYGTCDKIILPTMDAEESLQKNGSESYFAIEHNEIVGGVTVVIDSNSNVNHLELLYVKSGCQSKGVGLKIWQTIELMYPQTKIWETYTPYFDKRNIHFYVNKCGFHIVEFFNPKHKDPNVKDGRVGGMDKEVGQYFFRFEKIVG